MKTVGVIGAGQMGSGIAQVTAQAGIRVLLCDVDLALAEKAAARIAKGLARLVEKDKITAAAADTAIALIHPVADYAPMAEADLIIEAATEREDIKARIFDAVGKVLGAQAILASNTSSIPITRMAAGTTDAARFVGVHFFNPVPLMKLVEIIPGLATSSATIDTVRSFAWPVPPTSASRVRRALSSRIRRRVASPGRAARAATRPATPRRRCRATRTPPRTTTASPVTRCTARSSTVR